MLQNVLVSLPPEATSPDPHRGEALCLSCLPSAFHSESSPQDAHVYPPWHSECRQELREKRVLRTEGDKKEKGRGGSLWLEETEGSVKEACGRKLVEEVVVVLVA